MKRRTTLYMYSTMLVFDLILMVLMLPFFSAQYHYSINDQSCIRQRGFQIKITLRQWMLIDASVVLSLLSIMTIVSLLFMVSPACSCFHGLHVCLCFIFGLFRLSWLIVGGILFWRDIQKRKICHISIVRFMKAVLITGYIYSVLYFIAGHLFPRPTIRVPKQLIQQQAQLVPQIITQRHLVVQQNPMQLR